MKIIPFDELYKKEYKTPIMYGELGAFFNTETNQPEEITFPLNNSFSIITEIRTNENNFGILREWPNLFQQFKSDIDLRKLNPNEKYIAILEKEELKILINELQNIYEHYETMNKIYDDTFTLVKNYEGE